MKRIKMSKLFKIARKRIVYFFKKTSSEAAGKYN